MGEKLVRFDPQVEVICDECDAEESWQPDYVYMSISGAGGHYDTSDSAFKKWCAEKSWTEDGDKTYCEDCTNAREATQ